MQRDRLRRLRIGGMRIGPVPLGRARRGDQDADTSINPHSLQAARRAAGAVICATEAVLAGRARRAFCNIRPPGHHATRDAAMGFCLFNNVVIGLRHALAIGGIEPSPASTAAFPSPAPPR